MKQQVKVPKLRRIPTATDTQQQYQRVVNTARQPFQGQQHAFDMKRSLSARNAEDNGKKFSLQKKNPRTALAAKIKALADLDLNSVSNMNGNGKPRTPRNKTQPVFKRAYNVSKGNAKRSNEDEDLQVPEWSEDPGTSLHSDNQKEATDSPPGTRKPDNVPLTTKPSDARVEESSAPRPIQRNENTAFRQRKPMSSIRNLESEIAAKNNQLVNLKKRLSEHENMLKMKVDNIAQLQSENSTLSTKLRSLEGKHKVSLKEKVKEVMSLQKAVSAFKVEKNNATETSSKLLKAESDSQALRAQVTKLASALNEKKLEEDKKGDKTKVEKLRKEVTGLQGERKSLLTQIDAMKGALGVQKLRISELEERLRCEVRKHSVDDKGLGKKFANLQTQHSDLCKKYEAQKAAFDALRNIGTDQAEEKRMLEEDILKLKAEVESLQKQILAEKKMCDQLSKDLDVEKRKLRAEEANHLQTRGLLAKEIKLKDNATKGLVQLRSEKATLVSELAAERKVISDLSVRVSNLEAEKRRLEEGAQEAAQQKSNNEMLKRKMREADACHVVAIRDLKAHQEKYMMAEKSRADVLKTKVEELQKQLAATGLSQNELDKAAKQIDEPNKKIAELLKTNKELELVNKDVTNENNILNGRCSTQQMSLAKQSSTIAEQEKIIATLQEELQQLQTKLSAANLQLEDVNKAMKILQDDYDKLKHELMKITVQLEASEDSVKRQAKEIDSLKADLRRLEVCSSDNAKRDKDLKDLHLQLDVANEKISKLLLQKKSLHDKLKENEQLTLSLKNNEAKAKKHIADLEKTILELKNALAAEVEKGKKLASGNSNVAKAEQSALKQATEAKTEAAQLLKQLKAASATIEALREELKSAKSSNRDSHNKRKANEANLKDLNKELKTKSAEADKSTAALKDREKELAKLNKLVLKLSGQLEIREKEIVQLKMDAKNTPPADDGKLEAAEKKIKELTQEMKSREGMIQKLKAKLSAKAKSDKESMSALEKNLEQMTSELVSAKKESATHKKALKDHVNRLQIERKKSAEFESRAKEANDLLGARDEHIVKCREQIQRLKRIVNTAETSARNKMEADKNTEKKSSLSMDKVREIAALAKSLDEAIAAEAKGKGYISNVNVLIKTGEMSTHKKSAECHSQKVSNLEQRVNVLLYNVKYAEKQISKYDEKVAQKQVNAREEAMKKLEKKFAEEEKKAKRFKETSTQNVDELKALLPGAKKKLQDATEKRKSLVNSILELIERA